MSPSRREAPTADSNETDGPAVRPRRKTEPFKRRARRIRHGRSPEVPHTLDWLVSHYTGTRAISFNVRVSAIEVDLVAEALNELGYRLVSKVVNRDAGGNESTALLHLAWVGSGYGRAFSDQAKYLVDALSLDPPMSLVVVT